MSGTPYKKPITKEELSALKDARFAFALAWIKQHGAPRDTKKIAAAMKRAGLYSPTSYIKDIAGWTQNLVYDAKQAAKNKPAIVRVPDTHWRDSVAVEFAKILLHDFLASKAPAEEGWGRKVAEKAFIVANEMDTMRKANP